MQRILNSLKERGLELPEASKAKIVAFAGDLSQPDCGLDASILAQMKHEVSSIIHIAWPVNFKIHLQSFEPHIAGLHNLLQFSLSVQRPQPAQLFFCSSISTALNTPPPASISDGPIEDFTRASSMGYAQSKLVGEHIVRNAACAGAPSYVLRIGQIVGDARNGVWNDKEFIPLMIRSALMLNALPALQEVRFLSNAFFDASTASELLPPNLSTTLQTQRSTANVAIALLLASCRYPRNNHSPTLPNPRHISHALGLRPKKQPFCLLQPSQPARLFLAGSSYRASCRWSRIQHCILWRLAPEAAEERREGGRGTQPGGEAD